MYRNRIIPCILIENGDLVKTKKFKKPVYVGDPINAVRIFNDKEVDELIVLDISATKENKGPNFSYIKNIAEECFMPLCYGGGIRDIEDIKKLFNIGIEKVCINTGAYLNPKLIKEASDLFGSQSIVVSIDVKKNMFGKYSSFVNAGKMKVKEELFEYVKKIEQLGAGELFINCIDREGTMLGYDIDLIKSISTSVKIPCIACGGAGKLNDFALAIKEGGVTAVAAGSYFVFYGPNKAVLINYPVQQDIKKILGY